MDAALTDAFEANRSRLNRLAYRMLGSVSEAEDAVQDAWLRWERAGEGVADPAARIRDELTGRGIEADVTRVRATLEDVFVAVTGYRKG